MKLLTDRYRMLVECPACHRPVHLSPGPPVVFTEDGQVGFDREVLSEALRLHLRLGCDRS